MSRIGKFMVTLALLSFLSGKSVKIAVVGITNVSQFGQPFRSERALESLGITQDLLSSYAEEVLTTLIASQTPYIVVERRKVLTLIKEQDFNRSGLVNNSDMAVRLGELLGANYIVTGSIVNIGRERRRFRGYGISTESIVYFVEASLKMLDVNTGAIVKAGLYDAEFRVQDTGFSQSSNTLAVRKLLKIAFQKFVQDLNNYYASSYGNKGKKERRNRVLRIDVISEPEGAEVEVDGIYMGSTPCKIEVERGKIVSVSIALEGYETWKKKVKAIEGLRIKVKLKKKE